jgi:hypothetical protein
MNMDASAMDEPFSADALRRRRHAARRLATVLGAIALALYIAGFWFDR